MKIVNMNDRKVEFVEAAREVLGGGRTTITRPEAMVIKESLGLAGVPSWLKKLKTENPMTIVHVKQEECGRWGCFR